MADLSDFDALAAQTRPQIFVRCTCGKWGTYVGTYDSDGYTLRCHGCLRSIVRCTCG